MEINKTSIKYKNVIFDINCHFIGTNGTKEFENKTEVSLKTIMNQLEHQNGTFVCEDSNIFNPDFILLLRYVFCLVLFLWLFSKIYKSTRNTSNDSLDEYLGFIREWLQERNSRTSQDEPPGQSEATLQLHPPQTNQPTSLVAASLSSSGSSIDIGAPPPDYEAPPPTYKETIDWNL